MFRLNTQNGKRSPNTKRKKKTNPFCLSKAPKKATSHEDCRSHKKASKRSTRKRTPPWEPSASFHISHLAKATMRLAATWSNFSAQLSLPSSSSACASTQTSARGSCHPPPLCSSLFASQRNDGRRESADISFGKKWMFALRREKNDVLVYCRYFMDPLARFSPFIPSNNLCGSPSATSPSNLNSKTLHAALQVHGETDVHHFALVVVDAVDALLLRQKRLGQRAFPVRGLRNFWGVRVSKAKNNRRGSKGTPTKQTLPAVGRTWAWISSESLGRHWLPEDPS